MMSNENKTVVALAMANREISTSITISSKDIVETAKKYKKELDDSGLDLVGISDEVMVKLIDLIGKK